MAMAMSTEPRHDPLWPSMTLLVGFVVLVVVGVITVLVPELEDEPDKADGAGAPANDEPAATQGSEPGGSEVQHGQAEQKHKSET